jgi:hypothetical protein
MQFAKHIKTPPAVRYPYTHFQILVRYHLIAIVKLVCGNKLLNRACLKLIPFQTYRLLSKGWISNFTKVCFTAKYKPSILVALLTTG